MYNCYRCGVCCIDYLVAVVSPKYVHLEDIDFEDPSLPEDFLIGLDGSKPCPHVFWDHQLDLAACKIHNKKWFTKTPCYQHRLEEACRIGKHVISNKDLKDKIRSRITLM